MTSVPETRASLLLRLRDARNQQAWTEFLEIYEPLISRLIWRRGVQDADVAEVTQEVLLAVASAIHRWEADPARGSFRGWLATIARNLVVNFLIRQSRQPRASGDTEFNRWLEDQPAPDGDVSALFDLERKRQTFRWASEQIREEFKESTWQSFWMTAVENRDVSEVAQILGVKPGVIYVSRSRVMKRLREMVEDVERSEQAER
ncbi:MAG: sigma-70 family RNA polymerase sigma factor [Planctomycetes bacterium]|nr:sigma-70 family RNA polymerase sigma factor [Planctomycetota bacterium]